MGTKPFSHRIPSLHSGISTQSQSTRFPSQVSDAENALFNVVYGVSTRAGTRHHVTLDNDASKLIASSKADFRMHRIIRDSAERYAVIYGRDGNSPSAMSFNVVDLLNPRNRVQYFTLGGPTGGTFALSFAGVGTSSIAYNASAATIKTNLESLSTIGVGNVTVTASGSWFIVQISDTVPYDGLLEIGSSLTGGAIDGPYGTMCKVTGLSGSVKTYLEGGSSTAGDLRLLTIVDTTVIANTKVATGTVAGTTNTQLDAAKMPVQMQRTSLVPPTFNLSQITWNQGATTSPTKTAPKPIIDGKTISDIAYHRGRLCFAMNEWLVTSQPNSLYNFMPFTSDVTYNDSDPIVVQFGTSSVSVIDWLMPFRMALLAFTRNGTQFQIGGGDTFTPLTATLTPSTAYATQPVRPTQISSYVYFAGVRENTSVIYEYAYDFLQVSNKAANVTQHVDGLLPSSIRSLTSSDNNDTVIVVPGNVAPDPGTAFASNGLGGGAWSNPNTWSGGVVPSEHQVTTISPGDTVYFDSYKNSTSALYLYRTLRLGNNVAQAAWTKYTFYVDRIMDVIIIDDTAYVLRNAYVQNKGVGTSSSFYRLVLDSMPIAADPAAPSTFLEQPRLDRRRVVRGGTYSGGSTNWKLDLTDYDIDTCVAMVNNQWTEYPVSITDGSGTNETTYSVSGIDLTGRIVVLGRSMPFSITTSRLFPSDNQGNALVEGELFINKIVTDHSNSGPYKVVVQSSSRPERSFEFDPKDGDFDPYGRLSWWTPGRAQDMNVSITNVDSRPTIITGIEFYGTHNTATGA